ncbi:hypothetical protein OHA40_01740 [Nocardia sp. NBC_00508]|uniref:hypothetical protein n=1 Tax=Nocardia sp. NBC_00508 TaxID=2975992 RepID=UPI002E7FED7A|nr:hypothetical protein [Nocardia sp. NBC_00508]WUD66919.1 hypothetical protein OHA40_01740 [Nocardia sp. NBC_00508]
MKSTVFAVAAVLATTVMTVLAPQTSAASGVLMINEVPYESWEGYLDDCLHITIHEIENYTDGDAVVYDRFDCTGRVIAVVHPNERTTAIGGSSVLSL